MTARCGAPGRGTARAKPRRMDLGRLAPSLPRLVVFAALAGCAAPAQPLAAAPVTAPSAAPASASPESKSAEITANAQTECDLVCERAQIVPRPADGPDYHEKATANANLVLEGMHDDLLACYKKRVAVDPDAHGFITVDIVIDPTGKVRAVETTGGAVLGDGTMSCLVERVKRASFEPPHGGGTLRIHVPFSLRRVAPGDQTL
jgi:hypothetical protein